MLPLSIDSGDYFCFVTQEIDSEIEELKKKYGMMSTPARSDSYERYGTR